MIANAFTGHYVSRHPCPMCGEYQESRERLERHYPVCWQERYGNQANEKER